MRGNPWSLRGIALTLFALTLGCISTTHAQMSSEVYGSAIAADNLANTVVGSSSNVVVSYRVRANHTGALQSISVYLIPNKAGYAAGTGGTIRVSINTDDGTAAHNPTSTMLASHVITNYQNLSPSIYFPQLTFPSPANLVAGQLYHVVFTNIDANPSANYLSVDALYEPNPPASTQPSMTDTDFAEIMTQAGQPWTERKGYTPTLQMQYTDGWRQGIGYMEVWYNVPQLASGSSAVREAFTVSGASKTVSSVTVRGVRVSGSDPLIVRLENADGTLIEEGSIPASSFKTGASAADAYGSPLNYSWATYTFSSARTLASGQSYHLDLEATSTSAYDFFPIRKGVSYGFQIPTYFPDGYAQFKVNGGSWNGWTEWGVANRTDADLQFYFTMAGAGSGTGSGTEPATSPATPPSPVISGAAAATSANATITWTTNQASTSEVQYGTTTAYASASPVNSALVTSHSVTLTGLTGGTVYHYRILSTNASGVRATSGDLTFTVQ